MFEIKCLSCGETATFTNGKNDETRISIMGEIEVLFSAEVYIECKCKNEITIEKP